MPELVFDSQRQEVISPDAAPVEFSWFRSVSDRVPKTVTLEEFLEGIQGGEWQPEVQSVRAGGEKNVLPAVTVSGVFHGGHAASDIARHSGLICMDFDGDDNPGLGGRMEIVKEDLAGDEFVRAAFVSAGGGGLAAICRVESDRHGEAFDALCVHFYRRHGLIADRACRDVSRLRFVSWDTDLVENEHARVFKRYSLAHEDATINGHDRRPTPAQVSALGSMTPARRSEIGQALSRLSPDDYEDWIRVGMAIHSEDPGMDGLALWREWSEYQDTTGKFDAAACGKKWGTFGRTSREKIAIEYVFKAAYDAGWAGPGQVMARPSTPAALPVVVGNHWAVTSEAPRDPIIEGLFDRGDKGDVVAPSKTRKSFFVLQMALHIAAGRDWFGMACVRPRRVLLLQLEVRAAWMHRRFNRMREAMGLHLDQLENIHVSNLRGSYGPQTLDLVRAYIQEHSIDIVIADPLYKLSDGDETIGDFKPIMAAFDALMEDTGAAVLWVHHDAKGSAGDRDIRDRGAGSGVLGRDCDFRIALTPQADNEAQVVLDVMPRNFPPVDAQVLEFEDGHFRQADAAPNPKTSRNRSTKRDPASVTADELVELVSVEPYPVTKKRLRELLADNLGVASGRKIQAFIDQMDEMFEHDARLIFAELPMWPTCPNPAKRPKRGTAGWGTANQHERERADREAAEIRKMEI